MSFYVQHGYGKGQKIQNLDAQGNLAGVILSPSDEGPAQLQQTVDLCNDISLRVLIDPQTYVYSVAPPGSSKRHLENQVDSTPIHWADDTAAIADIVSSVGRLNERLGVVDALIAPTVMQPGFSDVWTPVALQFARASASAWGNERTIVSIALEEQALSSWPAIDQWLDIITTLDVRGFYVVVQRNQSSYPAPPWRPESLANLLRLFYILGEVNGYEVIWGYSDIEGLLGLSTGASGIASGWNYGSRKFSLSKWQPSTGGRAPVPRLNILPLLTPVKAVGEANKLFESEFCERLFSREQIETFSEAPFESWSRLEAQEGHLAFCARESSLLEQLGGIPQKLDLLETTFETTLALFAEIKESGLILDSAYSARIVAFRESIRLFRQVEAL